MRGLIAAGAALMLLALDAGPARAYDFEVRARTIGQASELRSFRFSGPDLLLSRRRFTQLLSLHIWDIFERRKAFDLYDARLETGPRFYFTSYMRIDHDFGEYTTGDVILGSEVFDAVDLVPELEATSLQLDLLFGYFAAEDLAGGWIDAYVGRQLEIGTLDWFAFDGAKMRVKTPWWVSVEGFGGLRVREESPLGSYAQEPDGTAGAECQEYVEGETPGSGSWRPIDRSTPLENNPFRNDYDFCPQRRELMPTFGGAIATRQLDRLIARVSYRRSVSQTPGLIGAPDRFDNPDVGLYPNELGQAPSWGVNEEVIAATLRAPLDFAEGRGQVTPYAAARYSFLHGLIDQAHAGVALRYTEHVVEPELYYSFPTFDGDSIFNVFSAEPYTDARLTYRFQPQDSPLRTYVRGWLRRFSTEDDHRVMEGVEVDENVYAGGAQAGVRYLLSKDKLARLDLFHEDGYGGRRTGGYATARWSPSRSVILGGRLLVIDFDEDSIPRLEATNFGLQVGGTYVIHDGVAVSLLAEENVNRFYRHQLALIGLLDLAFNRDL